MTLAGGREVRSFAPGHVTGLFGRITEAADPRARGSIGAGIVLELGVRATARHQPDRGRRVRLTSDLDRALPISEEVAWRLLPATAGRLSVHLVHELPVGQGFGMSAAGATATALAVAGVFGARRARALEVAHLADLFGRGGLGGVAAIVGGGGLEVRRRAGLPPRGEVVHRPLDGVILLGVVGAAIPSPAALADPRVLADLRHAATGLPATLARLTPERFWSASERFTDRAGLASTEVRRALRALRSRGCWAAQSMFGGSLFARPRSTSHRAKALAWLEDAGVRAVEVGAAPRGAFARRAQPF